MITNKLLLFLFSPLDITMKFLAGKPDAFFEGITDFKMTKAFSIKIIFLTYHLHSFKHIFSIWLKQNSLYYNPFKHR